MKKRIIITSCMITLCILLGGYGVNKIKANSFFSDRADVLKEEINQSKTEDNSSVLVQGKSFKITENDVNAYMKAYKLNNDADPEASAIKYLVERKTLLNKALELNYNVTEEEVDKQISKVKEAIKGSDNYDDYLNFINEYGGEDAYWNDIRETTKDTMIINKYLDDQKAVYNQTNKKTISVQNNQNLLDEWNKRKEELTNDLIKEQDITVNDNKYNNLFSK